MLESNKKPTAEPADLELLAEKSRKKSMKRKRQKQSKKERAQIAKAPEIAPSQQKFRQELLHGEATEESAHHTVKDTVHFVASKDHVVKRFKVVMPSSMSL